ncbi:hypothetical protein PIB30_066430 [Stylosanthes scabra]|uniref:Uncharacterized protein n=1 Tax=Stylosanthes scabra TaxID=79078 RepID=A0ABU6VQL3_9FABA|nr:hypothetical protein [Stylosanthes scabra]
MEPPSPSPSNHRAAVVLKATNIFARNLHRRFHGRRRRSQNDHHQPQILPSITVVHTSSVAGEPLSSSPPVRVSFTSKSSCFFDKSPSCMSITTAVTVFACIAGAPPRLPCRITAAIPAATGVLRGRRRSLTPWELVAVAVVLVSRAALLELLPLLRVTAEGRNHCWE